MYDPSEKQLDKDVEASMQMFESAHVGTTNPVQPIRPKKVLVALDGSDQDDAALTLAFEMHEHYSCEIGMVDSREDGDGSLIQSELDLSGVSTLSPSEGAPYEIILKAQVQFDADLVIVPCPHGRDLRAIGPDSTGTVIDVLLARSAVPILVVRGPVKARHKTLREVQLRLFADNDAAPEAAAWASGLAVPNGMLRLVLVVESDYYEKLSVLLKKVDPTVDVSAAKIADALENTYRHLHMELSKSAKEQGFEYHLDVVTEIDTPTELEVNDEPRIFRVLALDRGDQLAAGHITERIRFSLDPVLVVPA